MDRVKLQGQSKDLSGMQKRKGIGVPEHFDHQYTKVTLRVPSRLDFRCDLTEPLSDS